MALDLIIETEEFDEAEFEAIAAEFEFDENDAEMGEDAE